MPLPYYFPTGDNMALNVEVLRLKGASILATADKSSISLCTRTDRQTEADKPAEENPDK